MKLMARIFLLLCITVLMVGCKLAVIVVEGGSVQSTGSGTCVAGTICVVDVTDPNFSETFTAIPDTGWYFRKWNSGNRLFCGGSTNPTCILSFQGYEESKEVADIVATSETFYLMPMFTLPQPISRSDVVIVNDREWAQPDLFVGLSWDDIKAVCPAETGVCRSGYLNGYNMAGWTWASVDDIAALFNFYIGSEVLGQFPATSFSEYDSVWLPKFFDDGWRSLLPNRKRAYGVSRSTYPNDKSEAFAPYVSEQLDGREPGDPLWHSVDLRQDVNHDERREFGAWFYRDPLIM
jgi:hypothetical protein